MSAILADVLQNTDSLVRQELELAMARLEAKVESAKTDLRVATAGAAVLYAGALALVAACVLGLARVMEPWLSALSVGLAVSAVGYLMLQRGESSGAVSLNQSSQGGAARNAPMTRKLQETSK